MNRIRFTKRALERLPAPAAGRAYYYDEGQPNLALMVSAGGARHFYRTGRVENRPVRILIGAFPDLSVEQARTACRKLNGRIAAGENPHRERQARRTEATVADLWSRWEAYMAAHKRPKSQKEDARYYQTFLKRWASRPLKSITRAEVAALHSRVGKTRGQHSANRLAALVSAMWGEGKRAGLVTAENPVSGLRRFKEEARDRWLNGNEIRALFRALSEEPIDVQDFIAMCLLTAARKQSVLRMAWAGIDLDRGLWRIGEAKGGKVVVVPLVDQAVAILRRRQQDSNGSPWVFPGRARAGHIAISSRVWQRITKKAGLTDARLHDVRRTTASWMAAGGVPLLTVAKALGHSSIACTEIYARLGAEPVRQALSQAADAMMAAAKQEGTDNAQET